MNKRLFPALLLLAACGGPAVKPPLEGAAIGGSFQLTDGQGRATTDRSFAGRYRIMYFGYTFCPDVCPTDMATLSKGLQEFAETDPDKAKRVALVFVTVDPERDTVSVVRQFAANFGATGLTGTPQQIDAVKKAYAIYSRKQPGSAPDAYLVDHSRSTYLMDPDGKPVALLPADGKPADVAAELRQWVQ